MVKIYLVRHCEAEGNKAKIFQGTTDCDISNTGALQLEFLKSRFKNIHIDKAYSSPLTRALKTACAVVEDKGIKVIINKDFIEMDGGFIEGMPFKKIFTEHAELERVWNEEPQNFLAKGGESMREVYTRAKNAIHKLVNDPDNQDKTILISTHGAVTRCLMCYLMFGDIEKLNSTPWSNNTAVSLVLYNEGKFNVEFANDDSHVPEEFMPAANRIVSKMWQKED